jgi:hypothetical protein
MPQLPNQFGNNFNEQNENKEESLPRSSIQSYVFHKITDARKHRDSDGRRELWDEYTRLWRGFHISADKTRNSERSRLIAPALQQAIEMTVAEELESTFGRQAWFDIDDDIEDREDKDIIQLRDSLLEDFELAKVPDSISESYLLAALYGTGILKLNVRVVEESDPIRDKSGSLYREVTSRVVVEAEAVRPDEFLIDPAAKNIDEALFCVHEITKPRHLIEMKQGKGVYRKGTLGNYSGGMVQLGSPDGVSPRRSDLEDQILISEYYGRVPANLLTGAVAEEDGMVEAIVTLANETFVLRAVASPYTMKDRPIVAFQHDTVPGEFWGRGVAEKGYNPQKALDAELRARIDALAVTTSPMMGADVTRLPRDVDLRVRPGKVWLTRGRPTEVLEPLQFPPINPATFQQTGDLERMVQMGTGAMDSATPLSMNRRNETASGMSQLNASFIKRAKRTMYNIERNLLNPLIKKALWRYMQFWPQRYPTDFKFIVKSTMGIMAKEFEQTQLTQLMGFIPPESPAFNIILGAIFQNTSSANNKEIRAAFEAMSQGPSPEEQQLQEQAKQLELKTRAVEIAKTESEVQKNQAQAALAEAERIFTLVKADLEDDKVEIQAANAVTGAQRSRQGDKATQVQAAKVMIDAQTKDKDRQAQRNGTK